MFKAIFCKEENRDALERLIEEVIGKKVSIIRLDVPEVLKNNILTKGRTLDVLARCEDYLINIDRKECMKLFEDYNNMEKTLY